MPQREIIFRIFLRFSILGVTQLAPSKLSVTNAK